MTIEDLSGRLATVDLYWWLIIICLITVIVISRQYRQQNGINKTFRELGIQPSKRAQNELQSDLTDMAVRAEKQEMALALRKNAEVAALRREDEKVIEMVVSSPEVVAKVGAALTEIENEYYRRVKQVRTDAAKEALRLAAQHQIVQVLKISGIDRGSIPNFQLNGEVTDDARLRVLRVSKRS